MSATKGKTLAAVIAHNRDDEREHATLLVGWLHGAQFSKELKEILSSDKDLSMLWD